MTLTLGEIAGALGLECPAGAEGRPIGEVGTLAEAGPTAISFLANKKYRAQLGVTRAAAVLVSARDAAAVPVGSVALIAENPYGLLPSLMRLLHPDPVPLPGVHASAVVAGDARIDPTAEVGAGCVIGAGAQVGADSRLAAGCILEEGAVVGAGCRLHPRVVIGRDCRLGDRVTLHAGVVVGSDGFGFAPTSRGLEKIPQIGIVVIEDDVEIGANSAIDRATFGATRIGRGAKLDNLIQVAHNVEIGAFTVIAAQTGIAGSSRIGAGCMIGGQAGIVGHLTIGDGAQIAAQSGVMRDVPAGEKVGGSPAVPHRTWLRGVAALDRLAAGRAPGKERSDGGA